MSPQKIGVISHPYITIWVTSLKRPLSPVPKVAARSGEVWLPLTVSLSVCDMLFLKFWGGFIRVDLRKTWLVPSLSLDTRSFILGKKNCKGPHTINAANVGSIRDLISQKNVKRQTTDCKDDNTWKTFRNTNMTSERVILQCVGRWAAWCHPYQLLKSIKYFRSRAIGLTASRGRIFPSYNWGIPIFKTARVAYKIWRIIKTIASIWG